MVEVATYVYQYRVVRFLSKVNIKNTLRPQNSPGLGVSVSNTLKASFGIASPQLNGAVGEGTFHKNTLLSIIITGPLHILPSLNVTPDLPTDCICSAFVSDNTEVNAPAVSNFGKLVENAFKLLDRPFVLLSKLDKIIGCKESEYSKCI